MCVESQVQAVTRIGAGNLSYPVMLSVSKECTVCPAASSGHVQPEPGVRVCQCWDLYQSTRVPERVQITCNR